MTKKTVTAIILLVVIVGASYVAYQYFVAPLVRRETEETGELTLETIENAEYYVIMKDQKVKLISGLYESTSEELGLPESILVTDKVAFGDVNGDGEEDAAVILETNLGGSGFFYQLAIMINRDERPFNVANKNIGDRIIINSIDIRSGVVVIDMVTHSPGDALCCPSLEKVVKYKLSGEKLIKQ
ncbi:MAG TPA: hypothetical protein VHT73_05350 [Thermodesulfobacteriota bacterium]|nr:hypothetical protein [Thermodesulfobacteriota bacterium]